MRTGRGTAAVSPVSPALRIVAGLVALIALGTLLMLLPGVGAQRSLTLSEAFFTATSALTVTGLSVIVPSRDLSPLGQTILLCLIQVGGVGFMTGAVVVFGLLGRRLGLLDRIALRDSLGLLALGDILRLARRITAWVLAIEAIGALLLWLGWRGELPPGRAAFFAVFHAVSAFCNAGFDLFSGRPEFPNGLPGDGATLAVLGGLILLGGLGIPVLAEVFSLPWRRGPGRRPLSLHSRITLAVVAGLVVAGGVGLFVTEGVAALGGGGVLAGEPWHRRLGLAFFQSVSARTAGFVGLPRFENMAPASQLLMLTLMFIGCAPASMGGGITTGTFAVLVLALWSHARGLPDVRVNGRRIGGETVRRASAVLSVSLLAVAFATWLLLVSHPGATLAGAVFEIVSAFATCGLTLAFTDDLNPFGRLVICLLMFWGRLGALTLIVALARPRPPRHVAYPEEPVLIG